MAAIIRVDQVNMTPEAKAELQDFARKFSSDVVITDGYIRDDYQLNQNPAISLNVIPFTVTQQQTGVAPASPNAQRLKADDAFLARDIAVNWGFSPNTAAVNPSIAQASQMDLYSNPETLNFPNPTAADITSLTTMYNGWLSIKQGSIVYFQQLAMREFFRVGQTQKGFLPATGGTNQSRSEWDSMNWGFYPMTGVNLRMSGRKNYDVNINSNAAMPFAILAGGTGCTWAVLRVRGFLATGGAAALD